jgi:hypothetical protein
MGTHNFELLCWLLGDDPGGRFKATAPMGADAGDLWNVIADILKSDKVRIKGRSL